MLDVNLRRSSMLVSTASELWAMSTMTLGEHKLQVFAIFVTRDNFVNPQWQWQTCDMSDMTMWPVFVTWHLVALLYVTFVVRSPADGPAAVRQTRVSARLVAQRTGEGPLHPHRRRSVRSSVCMLASSLTPFLPKQFQPHFKFSPPVITVNQAECSAQGTHLSLSVPLLLLLSKD